MLAFAGGLAAATLVWIGLLGIQFSFFLFDPMTAYPLIILVPFLILLLTEEVTERGDIYRVASQQHTLGTLPIRDATRSPTPARLGPWPSTGPPGHG